MKKLILSFALLFGLCFQVNAQDRTWVGDGGADDWGVAGNWNPAGVPTSTEYVSIPGGTNVNVTGTHTVQRIKTEGSGQLTVTNTGNLTIAGATVDIALSNSGGSGKVFNEGIITIENTVHEGGLCKGTWTNNGTLNINNTTEHCLRVQGGNFTNSATGVVNITMKSSAPANEEHGLQVDDNGGTPGIFTNDGTVNITMPTGADAGSEGVDIRDGSELVNNATFNITASGGDMGIRIRISTANTSKLSNNGTLTITGTIDEAILIEGGGEVNNNNGGIIDCSNSAGHGIDVRDGTFNNADGALFKAIATKDGVFVRTAGTVNNDGDMWLDLCTSEEIEIEPGSVANFNNSATATFHPGSSPGDFEVKGDYSLGTSTTTFEITGTASTTEFDQIKNFASTGNTATITITDAKVHLDWGTFVPAVGNKFKIIDGSGDVSGTLLPANITSSNPSIEYVVNYDSDGTTEVEIEVTALLPVELNSFEGKISNATSHLTWETQTEQNNDYFEVQHSTNGREFSTIGMVHGNGTTSEVQNYDYTHKDLKNVDNYYRLKQVDFDGDFEYSDIIYLQNERLDAPVAIYPNPARASIIYNGSAASLTFFDIQGKQVKQQVANERTTIDISTLKSGVYTIEILTNTGNRTFEKLIKE